MEARGQATVPIYAPSIHPDLEKRYSPAQPEPDDRKGEKLWVLWRSRRFLWGVTWKTLIASIVLAFLDSITLQVCRQVCSRRKFQQ